MHDTITGPVFQEMLIFGAASIAKEKQSINDLNVFPVPDGDTGTNMSLTMHAAAQELQKRSPATVDLASSITASALLRGARGNSGVILSLLFRGMSKSLKGCVTADGCTFAAAMQEGVSAASGIGQKVIVIRHGRAADGDAFPIELQRYGAAALRDAQGLHPGRWQSHAVAIGIRPSVSTRLIDKNICSSFLV